MDEHNNRKTLPASAMRASARRAIVNVEPSVCRRVPEGESDVGPIYVTRPHLPELSAFVNYLERIWSTRMLSNDGPYHQELEQALAQYFRVPYVSLFSNATLALMAALKSLDISGEVITTPYSFPASTHCLTWCGITPVFCDIEPDTYTLDPEKIEGCITSRTQAILPVHVYGFPCRFKEIAEIAARHNLKVLYDAAHAFGVEYQGKSLLAQGDAAVVSFHATKIFNTFEGGAVVCNDRKMKNRLDVLRNHGIVDEVTVVEPGLNAKMNEVQAAMGLLQLRDIDKRIAQLHRLHDIYKSALAGCPGVEIAGDLPAGRHNFSYFPVLIHKTAFGMDRDSVYRQLKAQGIFARRYFYPLISDLPAYKHLPSAQSAKLVNAHRVSQRVLCLPIYADLGVNTVEWICHRITSLQGLRADGRDPIEIEGVYARAAKAERPDYDL